MTTRAPKHHTYHVHRAFYYTENSLRGILLALLRLFGWIDLDCHVTSDGVLVIGHGPRPMSFRLTGGFYDPGPTSEQPWPKVNPRATFEELTWAQVSRLRSRAILPGQKPYRISRADVLVPLALSKGLKVELEVKSAQITREQLESLAIRTSLNSDVKVRAIPNLVQVKGFPQFLPALHAASDAGYTTIVLTHPGHRHVPIGLDRWRPDYFRGMRPIWTGVGR